MLHKESKVKIKDNPRVFWEDDTKSSDYIGYMLASTNGYIFEHSKKYVLTKFLRPERVVILLPLLLDWAHYYYPRSINDTVYSRNIIYSVKEIFKDQSTKREIIIVSVPTEIAAVVKEPSND
jgi:hypothetical protein